MLVGVSLWVRRIDNASDRAEFVVFSAGTPGIPIVLPSRPIESEVRAAELLRDTLAQASRRSVAAFPIRWEGRGDARRAIHVGRTAGASALFSRNAPKAPFDTAVGISLQGGALFLYSERREAIVSAASWFLEKHLGAHWFMPGPLGEVIPRRSELVLTAPAARKVGIPEGRNSRGPALQKDGLSEDQKSREAEFQKDGVSEGQKSRGPEFQKDGVSEGRSSRGPEFRKDGVSEGRSSRAPEFQRDEISDGQFRTSGTPEFRSSGPRSLRDSGILNLGNSGILEFRPGFVSRDLGADGPGAREWYARNRLEPRLDHGHNLANIFHTEDFQREPEMAPMRAGQRFIPPKNSQNWQPNMLSAAAVRHAAKAASHAFEADPRRVSFSLSVNDAVRFDDSAETLAAVAPARFFRHRPDYSNLVFRFTNDVANEVARSHPDRWLPAYAYYWCENTPDFPIAPNVVPFLTADRSRWSFPDFAAEDRALIERWCRSGAKLVGVYDYFEGAPFLVPRPLLYTISASIPFEFQAGVRAFYGEGSPNWGFDGPKSWLAAQLLWDPTRDPQALLETYYRDFWEEAAGPMREFFAVCERVWQHQPGPPLWLRFYNDDDQAKIFSPEERAELRRHVDAARVLARTEIVKARVQLTNDALSVMEVFCRFQTARERVSRIAGEALDQSHDRAGPASLPGGPASVRAADDTEVVAPNGFDSNSLVGSRHSTPREQPATYELLLAAWQDYRQARAEFVRRSDEVHRTEPLALAPQNLDIYLRNQPDSRAAAALARTASGREVLARDEVLTQLYLQADARQIADVLEKGVEVLRDPNWEQVKPRPVGSSAVIDWTEPGAAWIGGGEPWEGRTVELKSEPRRGRVLRLTSCRTEDLGQWAPATPGDLYVATVNVRAKSSPGTATYLIVSFVDGAGKHLGIGTIDRLPSGDDLQETQLCVIARVPAAAKFIGFGVRVLNQVNDDFAEFWGASLRKRDP